ncbi:MAG TPA: lysophospholipid acyltransferase family protein [Gemmatimonadaceae bacterium]|nr:lysophospholipid acyltransferase family protein [Gemmatimonadaceae bacterium]
MISRALAFIARVISGATARWTAPLEPGRQRVFFANHTSHLDFIVIWSALPPEMRANTRPVAGGDYWGKGAIRRHLASKVFNAILIDRPAPGSAISSATKSIADIAAGMGDRYDIIVFPEGTRSVKGEILPFKSGLYHLCREKPHLELVPVYLANMNRILPKGEVLPVPLIGRVIVGAPMYFDPAEEKPAFLSRAREALLALRDQ